MALGAQGRGANCGLLGSHGCAGDAASRASLAGGFGGVGVRDLPSRGMAGSRQLIDAQFDAKKVPVAAVNFCRRSLLGRRGRIRFSRRIRGRYVIYRMYPERKVVWMTVTTFTARTDSAVHHPDSGRARMAGSADGLAGADGAVACGFDAGEFVARAAAGLAGGV